jgi:hypothetical protein
MLEEESLKLLAFNPAVPPGGPESPKPAFLDPPPDGGHRDLAVAGCLSGSEG